MTPDAALTAELPAFDLLNRLDPGEPGRPDSEERRAARRAEIVEYLTEWGDEPTQAEDR